jgi:hypothetical protein
MWTPYKLKGILMGETATGDHSRALPTLNIKPLLQILGLGGSLVIVSVVLEVNLPDLLPGRSEHLVPWILSGFTFLAEIARSFYEFILWAKETFEVGFEKQRQTAEAQRRELHDLVKSTITCEYIGNSTEGLERILEAARCAIQVRNTYVRFALQDGSGDSVQTQAKRVHEEITDLTCRLSQPARWIDIVSQDVMDRPPHWLQLWRNLLLKSAGRYSLRRMKVPYPILNFTILDYPGKRSTEVFFGQGHHSHEASGSVFRSQNEHVVTTFERFWEQLSEDSDPIEEDQGPSVVPADIAGIWFRVSYEVPEEQSSELDVLPPGVAIHDVALVRIEAEADGRRVKVIGNLYKPPFTGLDRGFSSVMTQLGQFSGRDWRLWFSTRSDEGGHPPLVMGFYRFSSTDVPALIDRFSGEYNSRAEPGKKLQILGFRFCDRRFANLNLGPNPKDWPPDRKRLLTAALRWWQNDESGEKHYRTRRLQEDGSRMGTDSDRYPV